jgi:hypothetical protein
MCVSDPQRGRPSLASHPRHKGNSLALRTLEGQVFVIEVVGPATYRL